MKPVAPSRTSMIKGTVTSTSTSTSPTTGFTLDVVGCSTPQFVTTNSSTTYSEPGTGITPTAVVAGEHVIVQLVRGASTLTASHVTILLARISGTVDSASASQLLVTDQQGFQRTVDLDVNGTTTFFPTGTTVVDGDFVDAFGTVASDHTSLDAVAIHVRSAPTPPPPPPPSSNHVSGIVGSVTPGVSFVLDEAGGTTETITTTNTKYYENGAPSPPTGVAPGENVDVQLVAGAATPTAKSVFINLIELNGTVESVGSTSFVLQDSQGFWRTVDVGNGTVYSPSDTTLAGLVGDHVAAFGTVDPDLTDLDADFVDALPTAASTWSNSQPWKGVPSGCPVTPPVATTFHPGADPDNAANGFTHDPDFSAGTWSSGQSSASTSSASRNDPGTSPEDPSGASHASSNPQWSGTANGDPPSPSSSPGSPGDDGAHVPQGGPGAGSGPGGGSWRGNGPGGGGSGPGGGGRGGNGPGGGR